MSTDPTPITKHLLEENAALLARLRRWARRQAAFYGEPVYLCGSALQDANPKPRDWDIRMSLSDDDFAMRFGDPVEWELEGASGNYTSIRWGWAAECLKRTKEAWAWCQCNVDFQIYPASHAAHFQNYPRLLLAAPGEPCS